MPIAKRGDRGTSWTDPSQVRSIGEDPVPAPGHNTSAVPGDVRAIPGWNIDNDKESRGFVPGELPSTVRTARGEVKHWQEVRGKVYVSNEHPGLTPVFGETQQPHGASGKLRDYAFEFGEGANRHWMALMAADRMERMGTLAADALRGRPDNWIAEKGWFASYNYRESNRTLITAALLFGGVILGGELWRRTRS